MPEALKPNQILNSESTSSRRSASRRNDQVTDRHTYARADDTRETPTGARRTLSAGATCVTAVPPGASSDSAFIVFHEFKIRAYICLNCIRLRDLVRTISWFLSGIRI